MNKGSIHLILAAIAALLLLFSVILAYFHYFMPDILLAGGTFVASLLAAATVLRRPVLYVYRFSMTRIGHVIPILDQHLFLTITISCIMIGVSIGALCFMFTEFVERYRYVNEIRRAVTSIVSDHAELPATETLVQAYNAFPGRREVPVLLVRTSRIFSVGGSWSDFVQFQRTYADKLFEDFRKRPDMCTIIGVDHDPVSYVATTYVESSVSLKNEKPISTEQFLERLREAIEFLMKCTNDTYAPRRVLPRMIYAARIGSVVAKYSTDPRNFQYDALEAIREIEKKIGELDASELVGLFQSHAYQEFLDFKIKTFIHSRKATGTNYSTDYSDGAVERVVTDIRRLLSLRMTVSIDSEMRWSRPPQKMDTFRMFMAKGGFMAAKQSSLLPLINGSKKLSKEMAVIFRSPVFEIYLKPEAWYKSTPLDLSIHGDFLHDMFERWMKKGW